MGLDLKELQSKIDNISDEDIEKYFPADTKPKGWLDIEEYLPMMYAIDIAQGYSMFKVKDIDGNIFDSVVSDHHTWYYEAKKSNITHWLND